MGNTFVRVVNPPIISPHMRQPTLGLLESVVRIASIRQRLASTKQRVWLFLGVIAILLSSGNAHATRKFESVTLNNASSVTVVGGATISATVTLTVSGDSSSRWRCTAWRISAAASGSTNKFDNADYERQGTYAVTFNITAPSTAGVYNAYFIVYRDDNCTDTPTSYTMINAVTVEDSVNVSSINLASTNPTSPAATVSWIVTFSRSVTGVDASDFSLVQSGGVSGASIGSVTGSGTTWTVTATTGTGSGSLGLNLVDNDSIRSTSNIPLGGSGAGNGNFTGQAYTVVAASTELLDFHMDEPSWSGSANEVIDSASGYHGTAASMSSTKPTTAGISPAISGNPGTCSYGVFNRANKDYVALPSGFPNLGADGAAFTITAWIRTTNNSLPNQRVFTDDEHNTAGYGFSVADGGTGKVRFFTRGTPSALILDTANVIANNAWYFVAAVADVPNKIKRIYVFDSSGTLLANASAQWSETSFGSDSGIPAIGGETNAATEANTSFGFAGYIDELRVFQGALTQASVQALMSRTRTCTIVNPVLANPVDFNCVEAGQPALTGHLYAKLSATPFNFDVIALKDANNDGIAEGVLTTYASDVNRNVSVELVDGSGTTDCRSRAALSPAIAQTLAFAKANQATEQGRKSSGSFTVAKAYQNLRCRVTDATNVPAVVGCSADSFSVRPTNFTVSSSLTGSTTIKTGALFSLSAASGVVGYNGSPMLDNSKLTAHSGAVQRGVLDGTFDYADPATGTAMGVDFSYSEVGYFNLPAQAVYDNNFTEIDAIFGDCSNDFANSAVNGKFGCKFGNASTVGAFGRFIPDHFDVSLNTPRFAPACNSFSYIGQAIKYATNPVVSVSAKNADGETTKNYTGSYWKINPSASGYAISPSYAEASHPLTVLYANVPAVIDLGNGTGTLSFANTSSDILAVTRSNSLAPFDVEIAMSFTLQDTDGVTAISNPVQFGAASAGNGMAFTGGYKAMSWGRLVLQNANGSELIPLPVPLFSEVFNGNSFVKNSADNCTTVSLSTQLRLSNPVTAAGVAQAGNATMTLAPTGTTQAALLHATLAAGEAGLSFSAPGSGNTGYIDINGQFSALPWLLFDWDGNGSHDNSPSARATFGIYKGNSKQIYWREVY